jgi:CheY-like chemotaxis protein
VRTFANADQLLGRIDDERPGCLIVDYALPGPNGLELLGALRPATDRGAGYFDHQPSQQGFAPIGRAGGRPYQGKAAARRYFD